MSILGKFGAPLTPKELKELLLPGIKDMFEPRPLPVKRPEQTFQPMDLSWYETEFNHRVDLGVLDKSIWVSCDKFDRIKTWLLEDKAEWGTYRKDWFCHFNKRNAYWYFMDREKAMMFRLSVYI